MIHPFTKFCKSYLHLKFITGLTFLFQANLSIAQEAPLPTEPGLYAIFHVVQEDNIDGSFVCELYYDDAPITVSNFTGLARGTQTWRDQTNGSLVNDTPFYDGLTFHRVSRPNKIIQTGSRNAQGTDGPGYAFPDELPQFTNHDHDSEGVLSMANSGVDTNGSQIFFTTAPTPGFDNRHSVFGKTIAGIDIIHAIGNVPIRSPFDFNLDEHPIIDVIITKCEILAIGGEAQNFLSNPPRLPALSYPSYFEYKIIEGNHSISFPLGNDGSYELYTSADLNNWQRANSSSIFLADATEVSFNIFSPDPNRQFAFVVQAEHPYTVLIPSILTGLRVTLTFDDGKTEIFDCLTEDSGTFSRTIDDETTNGNFTYVNDKFNFGIEGFSPAYTSNLIITINGETPINNYLALSNQFAKHILGVENETITGIIGSFHFAEIP